MNYYIIAISRDLLTKYSTVWKQLRNERIEREHIEHSTILKKVAWGVDAMIYEKVFTSYRRKQRKYKYHSRSITIIQFFLEFIKLS